jgi:thiopeptide-type bacteriocin biosynthesis protein
VLATVQQLFAHCATGRASGALRQLHFVRKPPGLRIRFGFAGEPDPGVLREEIERLLAPLIQGGQLSHWFPSTYEPEIFKFGGEAAMGDIDAYFSADSRGWCGWSDAERSGATHIDVRLFSATIVNDLILALLDDRDELWDVWCRIAVLHGGEVLPLGTDGTLPTVADLRVIASPREQALLDFYQRANRLFTLRLLRRFNAGKLLFGFRAILPHIVMAHWSRYGFSLVTRRQIHQRVLRALA